MPKIKIQKGKSYYKVVWGFVHGPERIAVYEYVCTSIKRSFFGHKAYFYLKDKFTWVKDKPGNKGKFGWSKSIPRSYKENTPLDDNFKTSYQYAFSLSKKGAWKLAISELKGIIKDGERFCRDNRDKYTHKELKLDFEELEINKKLLTKAKSNYTRCKK